VNRDTDDCIDLCMVAKDFCCCCATCWDGLGIDCCDGWRCRGEGGMFSIGPKVSKGFAALN
jgi:hypothetical protein